MKRLLPPLYTDQNGRPWKPADHDFKPWRYRSTVNKSPWWGLRTGSAVDSERGRFSNYQFPRLRRIGRMRLFRIMRKRENRRRFYPECYSRWD